MNDTCLPKQAMDLKYMIAGNVIPNSEVKSIKKITQKIMIFLLGLMKKSEY